MIIRPRKSLQTARWLFALSTRLGLARFGSRDRLLSGPTNQQQHLESRISPDPNLSMSVMMARVFCSRMRGKKILELAPICLAWIENFQRYQKKCKAYRNLQSLTSSDATQDEILELTATKHKEYYRGWILCLALDMWVLIVWLQIIIRLLARIINSHCWLVGSGG